MTGDGFLTLLPSTARSSDIPEEADTYGWFVGSWDLDVVSHDDEGVTRRTSGEAHATRVLEGRAVQDVFINPRQSDRGPSMAAFANWFGTTLRIYDPGIDAWHIFWHNPPTQLYTRQIGRARGADIVQEGRHESGALLRWSFTRIEPDSFRWLGEVSADNGANWRLQVEVLARRWQRGSDPSHAG